MPSKSFLVRFLVTAIVVFIVIVVLAGLAAIGVIHPASGL
jgi:hypothetical protein